jgi:hypothetical protein
MSAEANRNVQKLRSYCTVLPLPMSRPSHPALLIIENPCGAGLLGKLQRNAHYPAPAVTRALLLFQLRDALVSAPGRQPAPCPFGAPLWGEHHGHSESSTRGEYFPFCAQT